MAPPRPLTAWWFFRGILVALAKVIVLLVAVGVPVFAYLNHKKPPPHPAEEPSPQGWFKDPIIKQGFPIYRGDDVCYFCVHKNEYGRYLAGCYYQFAGIPLEEGMSRLVEALQVAEATPIPRPITNPKPPPESRAARVYVRDRVFRSVYAEVFSPRTPSSNHDYRDVGWIWQDDGIFTFQDTGGSVWKDSGTITMGERHALLAAAIIWNRAERVERQRDLDFWLLCSKAHLMETEANILYQEARDDFRKKDAANAHDRGYGNLSVLRERK